MSFTQNIDLPITVSAGTQGVASFFPFSSVLSGEIDTGRVSSGRIFYAGMMYDRFRIKSCSVRIRPKMMPAATGVPNYTLYIAWDRYFQDISAEELAADHTIVTDDPSAKMIVWSPGGNASTLSHYVYSLPKDRYQYITLARNTTNDPPYWINQNTEHAFYPTLRYVLDLGNDQTDPITVRLVFQFRFTLEFMGSVSVGSGSSVQSRAVFQPSPTPLVRSFVSAKTEEPQSQPLPSVRPSRWQST